MCLIAFPTFTLKNPKMVPMHSIDGSWSIPHATPRPCHACSASVGGVCGSKPTAVTGTATWSHGPMGGGAKCLVVLSDLSDTQLGGTSHVCLLSGRGRQISTKESNYIIVLHSYNLQLSSQQSQGCYLADGQLTPNNLVARNFRLVPQEEVPGWGCWIHGGLDLDRENRKKLTN